MNANRLFAIFKENVRAPSKNPTAGFDVLGVETLSPDLRASGMSDAPILDLRVQGQIEVFWCRADKSAVLIAGETIEACRSVKLSVVGGELTISRFGGSVHIGGAGGGVVLSPDGSIASTGDLNISATGGSIAAGRRIVINGVEISGNDAAGPMAGRAIVFLAQPEAPDVSLEGSGDVALDGLAQKGLELQLAGSGMIRAAGRVDSLRVELTGSGDVLAGSLEATSFDCDLRGSGNIHAFVTASARARLSGSGDIVVAGSPTQRDTRVQGSGDVRFK